LSRISWVFPLLLCAGITREVRLMFPHLLMNMG
jgi:hypothetical protein